MVHSLFKPSKGFMCVMAAGVSRRALFSNQKGEKGMLALVDQINVRIKTESTVKAVICF